MLETKVTKSPEKTLTQAELEKYQQLLADIGNRKKDGFVMIVEATDQEKATKVDGLLFGHQVSRHQILLSLVRGLGMSEIDVLMAVAQDHK